MSGSNFFAVVSWPRSGTHMLESALNVHSMVEAPLEPFNSDKVTALSARAYLDEYANIKENVGITLHWDHIRPIYRDIWNIIIEEKWPIISLDRVALLEQYISLCIADNTGHWSYVRSNQTFAIDIQHFISWAKSRQANRLIGQEYLLTSKRSVLSLSYECLVDGSGYKDVQNYLQLPVEKISPQTKKQGRSLEETIINYEEVLSNEEAKRLARLSSVV